MDSPGAADAAGKHLLEKRMAAIREYIKKKEKRGETGNRELDRQISRHRLAAFVRTLLLTGVLLGLCALVYVQLRNQTYSGFAVVSSTAKQQFDGSTVLAYQNGYISCSRDGVSYTDSQGNAMWNQTYQMQSPIIFVKEGWVAVGDYNGHTIYDISADGTVQEIDTNLPIRGLTVSANGVVAAVLEDGGVTWINVYNPGGDHAAVSIKTTMQKSGYPMSVSLSDNGRLMQTAYLRPESGSMKAVVSFYNFGEVGQNYTDTMVSSYEYADSVVPFTAFMDSKTAFSVADNQLMIYNDEGAEIPKNVFQTFLDEEIQDVRYSKDYIGLVFFNAEGGDRYRLDLYDRSGKKVLSKTFDLEYRDILFARDSFIIYSEAECMICNMQGGEKYAGDITEQTLLLKPMSGNRYLAVTRDSLDILEMR